MSGGATPRRLKVGVIGGGLIAQLMHLPHLRELDDLFDLRAVCDASPVVAAACARRFAVAKAFTDWEALLGEDLDAVLVLTSGSHATVSVAAAGAGCHVLVEKPMCYSVAEADEMIAAASAAGVVLMVGYPKRYDPAYARVADVLSGLDDVRFVRLTTTEAPGSAYVAHRAVVTGAAPPDQVAAWREDAARRVDAALGPTTDRHRRAYEGVLLDTMVHEFNLLRGLLGEPSAVKWVSLAEHTTTVVLDFDGLECVVAWLDLPGIARYGMEVCFYDPAARVRLLFPSPYLRDTPTVVDVERGDRGGPYSSVAREVAAFESPFKLELRAFHRAICDGTEPPTSGADGRADLALCQSVILADVTGRPVGRPTLGRSRP